MDAFGTDEATFVTLLKGYWFLGILISHKPLLFDRCPLSGYLVGVPRWLPMDDFDALDSAIEARKRCMSYSKDFISMLGVWDCAQKPHSLSDDKAKMGYITSTCKSAEQAFPLSNLGAQVSHSTLQFPQIFHLLSRLQTPWVGTWGGADR
jgi:hypothetical protein